MEESMENEAQLELFHNLYLLALTAAFSRAIALMLVHKNQFDNKQLKGVRNFKQYFKKYWDDYTAIFAFPVILVFFYEYIDPRDLYEVEMFNKIHDDTIALIFGMLGKEIYMAVLFLAQKRLNNKTN